MPKGFVYILECSDGSYYTGSTLDIEKRIQEHQDGRGANHTKKRLPVTLVYVETFQKIDDAFYREKQIQGWSRKKKEALISETYNDLLKYSECKNTTHSKNWVGHHVVSTPLNHQKTTMNKEQENSVAERSRSYSNGKLLLTGEYVVLDGALALAVPTSYGQSLSVKPTADSKLHWKSYDDKNTIWHEALFEIKDHAILKPIQNDDSITKRLLQVLQAAKQLNPDFLNTGFSVENKLSFPRHWGLGTSSTLINNIAHWAQIDAYQLLHLTFGGSGYDIACAKHNLPITYQLQKPFDAGQEAQRLIKEVDFNPIFKDCLYFVYLNKKQNSREGIAHYKANALSIPEAVQNISALTLKMIACSTLNDFESLIDEHEQIISKLTKQTPVKHLLFSDFKGAVKSLGAWGGDFVLVTAKENPSAYFKAKGFDTVISYLELIL